jgi:hypothetical protein
LSLAEAEADGGGMMATRYEELKAIESQLPDYFEDKIAAVQAMLPPSFILSKYSGDKKLGGTGILLEILHKPSACKIQYTTFLDLLANIESEEIKKTDLRWSKIG